MKLTAELLRDTAQYIKDYYDTSFSDQYSFHNYTRTVNIVRTCDVLAVQMNTEEHDSKIAHLASWFLETGYSLDYNDYQVKSVELAKKYLQGKGISDEAIGEIEECILSTCMPQQPVSVAAQLVCDAGMYHFGEKATRPEIDALRNEYADILKIEFSDEDWTREKIKMVTNHFYFTKVARNMFQKRKYKRLAGYQKKLELLQTVGKEKEEDIFPSPDITQKIKESAEEYIKTERGVETFFRVSQRRHMDLSKNAHDKASLLISINSIVISIFLSVLITKLDENRYLLLPTLLLVLTCSLTIILAIISTRPRLINRNSKNRPAGDNEINLLYFGDFSTLSLAEYKKMMETTYKSKSAVYESLSRDIYYQGIILNWKFKYVNIAYNIFLYGFITTVISFIIAFVVHVM
jgi:predicted metal-dependent HD superfamily phosphohydrolase